MEKYTNTISSIHFLNDRNISQNLSGDGIEFNPIPSLSLLNKVNIDLKNNIDEKINELDVNDSIGGKHVIITNLSQQNGKINYLTSFILSSDIIGLSENFINTDKFKTSEIINDRHFTTPSELTVYRGTSDHNHILYI